MRRGAGPRLRGLRRGGQVGMLAGQVEVMLGGGIQRRRVTVLGGRGWVVLRPCCRADTGLGGQSLRGLSC